MLVDQTVWWIGFVAHVANKQSESPRIDVDTSHKTTQEANKKRMQEREAKGARKQKKRMIRTEKMAGHNLLKQADGRWECGTCKKSLK